MESTHTVTIVGSESGKARLSYVIEYAAYLLLNLVGKRVSLSQVSSDVYMVLGHAGSEEVDFYIKSRFYPRVEDDTGMVRFSESLKFRSIVSGEFMDILTSDCNEQDEVIKAFESIKTSIPKFDELIDQIFKIVSIVVYPYLSRILNLPNSALTDKQQTEVVFMITSSLRNNWLSRVFIIKSLVHGFKVPLAVILPDGYFENFYMNMGRKARQILSDKDEDGEWEWR